MIALPDVCPPPPSATEQFLDKGIVGVVAVVLAGVILFLWRALDKLHAKNDALNELRLSDRDLRLADTREGAKVNLEVVDGYKTALTANTEELKDLKEELRQQRQPPRGYR